MSLKIVHERGIEAKGLSKMNRGELFELCKRKIPATELVEEARGTIANRDKFKEKR